MKFATLLSAALVCASAIAGTRYVSTTGSDDYDGKAPVWDGTHGPKLKIQSAIEAAEAGDTVLVAPGVYGDEQGSTAVSSSVGHTCRVFINKSITLKSEVKGGAVIVGRTAAAGGAVTGIRVASTVATGPDDPVEINGFVIRGCESDGTKSGGVIGWSGEVTPVLTTGNGPWVVDCVISNCVLSTSCNGAIGCVNAVRTLVKDIAMTAATSKPGVGAHKCNLLHSVIDGTKGNASLYCVADNVLVNCTITGCSHGMSSSNKPKLYNVLVTGGTAGNTYCTAAYNSILLRTVSAGEGNLCGAEYVYGQIASPIYGDYRPLRKVEGLSDNAEACDFGKAEWLDLFPEKYRYVDFEGKAFTADANGRIHAGAVQTAVTPVAGFYTGSTATVFAGATLAAEVPSGWSSATYTFLGEENWPKAFEVSAALAEGEHLFGFLTDDIEAYRFPNRDGKILYVPQRGKVTKITTQKATRVLYVDKATGRDKERTDGEAYRTIQAALDTCTSADSEYNVVYVAPGVYDEGARPWEDDESITPLIRVKVPSARKVRCVATSETEPTVILGAADTESETRDADGNGPKAVRCVRVSNGSKCCFQGFVITGGHTDSASGAKASYKGGGAFMCESGKNCWLMDCVVTNNFAAAGGAAMYGGKAARCRFADNFHGTGNSFYAYPDNGILPFLSGCVVSADDGPATAAIGKQTSVINCSIYSAVPDGLIVSKEEHGRLFNSIFVNNAKMGGNSASKCSAGNVLDGTDYAGKNTKNVEGIAYVNGSALFVDPAAGDFHLATASAAIGAGSAWGGLDDETRWTEAEAYSNYYALVQHDFDGNGPYFVNGKPTAGAYQRPTRHAVNVSAANLPEKVESGLGQSMVRFGETVTVSATAKDGRAIVGTVVDGVYAQGPTREITVGGIEDRSLTEVQVIVNTNWFVNANGGSDSNHGWTEDDAFHTLSQAVTVAESGDVVVALPGVYAEGSMLQPEIVLDAPVLTTRSRVVVPEGVALVSRDGAETTFIRGEFADTKTKTGEGAMRCVYLRENTRLEGFTVTGGSTDTSEGTASIDNTTGGGIFCEPKGATSTPNIWIRDCIISNNYSRTGGGGATRGGGFLRCKFFWNRAEAGGGGCADVSLICNCLFDHNRGTYGASQPYVARSCTFGPDTKNFNEDGARCALRCDPTSATWKMHNCLFLGGANCPIRHAYNCIIPRADFIYTDRASSNWVDVAVAEVDFDPETYAPDFDSAAMNAADPAYVIAAELEGDVYGNPRKANGGMDLGAVETDWRPRYAKDLGSRVTVTAADWNVVEGEGRTVRLPDGASLVAEWDLAKAKSATPSVKFTVAEGATLTIGREGFEPQVFGPGAGELSLANVADLERLTFAAAGGEVALDAMRTNLGGMLIIR